MERRPTDEILSPLPQPFRSALLSMYNREPQLGADGERHNLDGKTPFDRLKAAGYFYSYAGENVAMGPKNLSMAAVMKRSP